jgi:SAM-dependent methyltransferase
MIVKPDTEPASDKRLKKRILAEVYERQFGELSGLRRHICSSVPLRSFETIVEPGCGTGLLAGEICSITDASYTGIDIDERMLAIAGSNIPERENLRFVHADALEFIPTADAYLSSFFLAGLADPPSYLRKVFSVLPEDGLYIVFGEYNYSGLREESSSGLADRLTESLRRDGFSTELGADLDSIFIQAGFNTMASGSVRGEFQKPDAEFISMQLGLSDCEDVTPLLSWEINWGIYRS